MRSEATTGAPCRAREFKTESQRNSSERKEESLHQSAEYRMSEWRVAGEGNANIVLVYCGDDAILVGLVGDLAVLFSYSPLLGRARAEGSKGFASKQG